MRRAVHIILLIGGCAHFLGGHLGIMQVVAWAEMVVDYSSDYGLSKGVEMTFNGENPCARCHAIAAAKKEQSEQPSTPNQPEQTRLRVEMQPCPVWRGVRVGKPKVRQIAQQEFTDPAACSARDLEGPASPPPRVRA